MVKIPDFDDLTLRAVDSAMESLQENNPRGYLGASAVGDPCERKLWLNFRWVKRGFIEAGGLRRINDGHRGEQVVADMLRLVQGVNLSTEKEPGVQHSFEALGGHFRGNCDGLISGLLQDPDELYVWECKVINENKFKKLQKLRMTDESTALKNWDYIYYAQAQIYMHYFGTKKHYLTAASPGVRDLTSVCTLYVQEEAEMFTEKAKRVIFADRPASKISNDPAWHECKYCTFHQMCHGTDMPRKKSCRTCLHSSALPTGGWKCDLYDKDLDIEVQKRGCDQHLFVPDLVPGEQIDSDTDWIEYLMKDGTKWKDSRK